MKTTTKKTKGTAVKVVVGGKVVATGKMKTRTTHDYWHGAHTETVVLDADGFIAAWLDTDGTWYAEAAGAHIDVPTCPCEVVAA